MMQKFKILSAKVNLDPFSSSLSKRIVGLPALRIPLTMQTDPKGEFANRSMTELNLQFREYGGYQIQ